MSNTYASKTQKAAAAVQTRTAPPEDAALQARKVQLEGKARERAAETRKQTLLVARAQEKVHRAIEIVLQEMGYLPPKAPPFAEMRVLTRLKGEVVRLDRAPEHEPLREAVSSIEQQMARDHVGSAVFLEQLHKELHGPQSLVGRLKTFVGRIDGTIDHASVSLEPPETIPALRARMQRVERFLAEPWRNEERRGVLAIHVDEETRQTVLQIGVAQYGALYITIPRVLRPDEVAQNSLRELIGRLEVFSSVADPMAVINGAYQRLNFNYLFPGRVIRAPSGDTSRLAANLVETAVRERLSTENTTILNSAPATADEYVRIFPEDRLGIGWRAWGDEATRWENATSRTGFTSAPEASRDALLAALMQKQNVIVILAHCDGKSLYMPHPEPDGTKVTAEYLLEHRAEIAANKPFVYLFSCEAGDLANVENLASTLLDCGAAGVLASQTILGAAEGRRLLERLLDERRKAPPIEDIWDSMKDTGFLEMEVFLA
jgi:hypothetical protein